MPRSSLPPDTPREPELPAIDWIRRAQAEDEVLRDAAIKVRRRRLRRFVAGATLGLFGCVLTFHVTYEQPVQFAVVAPVAADAPARPAAIGTIEGPAAAARVKRPEARTLPDGTSVELDTGSEIDVAFTSKVRYVTLVRGTAHFQVVKNPAHPFVVRAGNVETRAVGTAFAVQQGPRGIDIVVTEGRVRVTSRVEPGAALAADTLPHALVDAGRRCVVEPDATPRVEMLPPDGLAAELAWRIPQLEFSRTPLHEVIALVNENAARHHGITFEVAEAGIRDIKLTGLMHADSTTGFERLLETSLHLQLERTPGKILIRGPRQ
jgi:transmembrane sensor